MHQFLPEPNLIVAFPMRNKTPPVLSRTNRLTCGTQRRRAERGGNIETDSGRQIVDKQNEAATNRQWDTEKTSRTKRQQTD